MVSLVHVNQPATDDLDIIKPSHSNYMLKKYYEIRSNKFGFEDLHKACAAVNLLR